MKNIYFPDEDILEKTSRGRLNGGSCNGIFWMQWA